MCSVCGCGKGEISINADHHGHDHSHDHDHHYKHGPDAFSHTPMTESRLVAIEQDLSLIHILRSCTT